MTARFFDLDALGLRLLEDSRNRAGMLRARGIVPCLALVEVGEDPQSATYVARKIEDCRKVGIEVRKVVLPASVTRSELLTQIQMLDTDVSVSGILVQLPLPSHLDENAVIQAISPHKDVDGLHPVNLLSLTTSEPTVIPCTVRGIDALLLQTGLALDGARVAILGRGKLVGLPASLLLSGQSRNTTVTILHRKSKNLGNILRNSDIIITASGSAHLVTPDMVRAGAVVIDVGMSWPEGMLCGDVHPDVSEVAGWMTPPDRSFGVMTRMMLLKTVLDLAEKKGTA
ncbi:bifunctional 5,10-methylene-tetrahydrofolate dehydrogenase/5,10-methylene-tetrahydrofolate cyclohydrolase [Gluconobacter oxydans]|uniref:bifunctional 5,10-methylenetetrahydrofolate dehydrogenase/5,10-methenyltetrahydrofolate cyclohydrolase n=1 Tax=Gluconobacter thailandicus TaxID=257438 RepID=UPI0002999484|nr:tetrahydrofolate dehydrogenase/cyclohydrolase catalytic domain-containing protein [Gluconobacter thailandicus]AFW02372.1 methenyltetrahydrofolate cyclohydrolase /5,10-methylenetetrahydrofolate dehydrogenase (NADP+) [Gluconobacter oxydans H24]ANQ42116.1 bifunctional 5,10-methylene-tetrahydrofolate dehydrogenase/5,10-methylene-tetrahydrofolate cyclohydrolase [Gluconobacter oxydans]